MAKEFDNESYSELLTNTQDFGIEERFKVYPIPTSNELIIKHTALNITEYSYSLYGVDGQKVSDRHNIRTNSHILDVTSIPDGVYILNIRTEYGAFNTRIIVSK